MSTLKKVLLGVILLTAVAVSGVHFSTSRILPKQKLTQLRLLL